MTLGRILVRMNHFREYHPIVNFMYFTAILIISIFMYHPAFIVISFVCSLFYLISLKGVRKTLKSIRYVMIIAILIVYAGITALKKTKKKILNPIIPDYNTISLVFIAVAIIVKVFLSVYFIKSGKKLKSSSLKN